MFYLLTMSSRADADERQKAELILEGQKTILEMIRQDAPLHDTLDAICRLVDAQAEGLYSSILLVENGCLRHGAAPHLPDDYNKAIDGIAIGDGVGSCGTAAALGERVIVEDIASHPYWAPFKGLAYDTHGLAACWSTPVHGYDGSVVATFALYHKTPKSPSLKERRLVDFATHLVVIAVNRAHDRAKLAARA